MKPGQASDEFIAAALHDAVHGLRESDPLASAAVPLVPWQRWVLGGLIATTGVFLVLFTTVTLAVLAGICTFTYLIAIADRILIFRRGLPRDAIVTVSKAEALSIPDDELPNYTVLVPAYDEPEVVGDLIGAMRKLHYPPSKLQVLLLLEEDDFATIEAAKQHHMEDHVQVLLVPAAEPRTKPKACNYGVHFATGDIITIFDAEDLPDPLQLRRVVAAFADSPDNVACVQAKLSFHNENQNLLTKWFTADYGLWFSFLLPGLMQSDAPIPLGGTSNHLKRSVLEHIGAWDPYNVTEDADLGVRIAANGYRTAVLDSVTLEEANSDPINWIRQRSRWYKGYLQTWLVHTRRPVRLWRQIGTVSFLRFSLLLAGTPIIACLNLLFWLLTLFWFLGQPAFISLVFPPIVYYPSVVCIIVGNTATIYMNLVAARENRQPELFTACLLLPLYWILMSIAAAKGCWQLIVNPSYWEKTYHGLHETAEET
ncbi:MAG: glycosyltransferase [Nocardiaceae bacterium]|nr:glycosyltransferase [Nocardiaceae bacterium]